MRRILLFLVFQVIAGSLSAGAQAPTWTARMNVDGIEYCSIGPVTQATVALTVHLQNDASEEPQMIEVSKSATSYVLSRSAEALSKRKYEFKMHEDITEWEVLKILPGRSASYSTSIVIPMSKAVRNGSYVLSVGFPATISTGSHRRIILITTEPISLTIRFPNRAEACGVRK